MADQLSERPLSEPHLSRLSSAEPHYDEILAAHSAALDRGRMFYVDPASGFSVLTAGYLAARGTCCQNGCRHCPYLQ
jgi:hypothetical protein